MDKEFLNDFKEMKIDLKHHVKRTDMLQDIVASTKSDIKWSMRIVSAGVSLGILIIGWLLWLNTTILSSVMD